MPAEKDSESSLSETRKSSKPIMEKRRRARINASLCELKSLLLEVMKKEGTRHNKMEKADILEMTVKHLRQIQRQQFAAAVGSDPTVINRYHSGFTECANEVTRYLSSVEGVDVELRTRMLNHLANSLQGEPTPSPPPQTPSEIQTLSTDIITIAPKMAPSLSVASEVNNNTVPNVCMTSAPTTNGLHSSPNKVLGGLQVIPSRLPSGEVAFVIPGNMLTNGQMPGYVIPVYTGTTTMMTSAGALTTQAFPSVPVQTVLTSGVPVTTGTLTSGPASSAVLPTTPLVVLPSIVPSVPSVRTHPQMGATTSSPSPQNAVASSPQSVSSLDETDKQDEAKAEVPEIKHEVLPEQNPDDKDLAPGLIRDENVWRPW